MLPTASQARSVGGCSARGPWASVSKLVSEELLCFITVNLKYTPNTASLTHMVTPCGGPKIEGNQIFFLFKNSANRLFHKRCFYQKR